MPNPKRPNGFDRLLSILERALLKLTEPSRRSLTLAIATDLPRSKSQLIAENALLREQLIILHRQVHKPRFTQSGRLWLVLLASRVRQWKDVLLTLRVKPDTLLRWHRLGFQLFWKFKSRNHGGRPKLAPETIALIHKMAQENSLWGAERTPKVWRAPQTPYPSCHHHHQKVFASDPCQPLSESNLVSFSQEP